jgi:hypothetical protein
MIVEAEQELMNRASRVNQARVHTGFHYPRSPMTAVKSMVLHRRFAADFPGAIRDDFQMLYAIARWRSKVSSNRFLKMFSNMGAPIVPATPSQAAIFSPQTIESVFACSEYAFDYSVLRDHIRQRLKALGLDLRLNTKALQLEERADGVLVRLSTGEEILARYVFNVTYSQINSVLRTARLPEANLKHELAEVALIRPPSQIEGFGITIMDGPFLSVMPYPAEELYSLTHVRYTPHLSWKDSPSQRSPYSVLAESAIESRHRHMILDGGRYVPSLVEAKWVKSLYEVKTVLAKNEADDGRPILYHSRPAGSRVISIMGGKIDNIYDLFDLVRLTLPKWSHAHDTLVYPSK